MKKPTATVYQDETDVVVVFSAVKDHDGEKTFRVSATSFENHWMDGGSAGLGNMNKVELNKLLKENNLKKKATFTLDLYCWSKHEIPNGAGLTCTKKVNHKDKCEGVYAPSFGLDRGTSKKYRWTK